MRITSHVLRHRFFYLAAAAGLLAWLAMRRVQPLLAVPVAGDAFFGIYVALSVMFSAPATAAKLRAKAANEDEGIRLIVLLALGAICFSLYSIFELLNEGHPPALHLALSLLTAPLGWLTLQIIAAFHYAHLYYSGKKGGLDFPGGTGDPDALDFLYYSFVVGMTAQVSDVQVTSRVMRRVTLAHSIVSFFYNTVLIALAVNVGVALAAQ